MLGQRESSQLWGGDKCAFLCTELKVNIGHLEVLRDGDAGEGGSVCIPGETTRTARG